MATPLLATKLYIPPPRPERVPRPRLVERLNAGPRSGRKLTLISAPAGFGKTTLLSEWVSQCPTPVAWLSLEESDNDLARFLSYLIAALQTIHVDIGQATLAMLQSSQLPPSESLLTALVNDIAAIPPIDNAPSCALTLVLDDYHLIETQPIQHALAAGDFERVARLVEETNSATMVLRGEVITLLGWLDALPDEVVRSRARLSLSYAWALMIVADVDAIEPRLQDALRALGIADPFTSTSMDGDENEPTAWNKPHPPLSQN